MQEVPLSLHFDLTDLMLAVEEPVSLFLTCLVHGAAMCGATLQHFLLDTGADAEVLCCASTDFSGETRGECLSLGKNKKQKLKCLLF